MCESEWIKWSEALRKVIKNKISKKNPNQILIIAASSLTYAPKLRRPAYCNPKSTPPLDGYNTLYAVKIFGLCAGEKFSSIWATPEPGQILILKERHILLKH